MSACTTQLKIYGRFKPLGRSDYSLVQIVVGLKADLH